MTLDPQGAALSTMTDPAWSQGSGLPGQAVEQVDGFIRKRAWSRLRLAQAAGLEVEDLIQEGRCGALKAATRFDGTRGVKFLTYAAHWIDAFMTEALRERLIYTPRGVAAVPVESGDSPGARSLDGAPLEAWHSCADLDQDPFEEVASDEALDRLRQVLPGLPSRDRLVLQQHFGLDGCPAMGLQELARVHGVSRQRISQILERSLAFLRGASGGSLALKSNKHAGRQRSR